jgi:Flp pilus assembly pilin Flp
MALINEALLRVYIAAGSLKARLSEERGQDLIEYAMLGGLIALAIAASVLFLQDAIADMADGISACVDFNSSTACAPF